MTLSTHADLDKYLNGVDRDMEPSTTPSISAKSIGGKCPYSPHCKEAAANLAVNYQLPQVN